MAKASGGTHSKSWRDKHGSGVGKYPYNSTEHIQFVKESLISWSQSTMNHNSDGVSQEFNSQVKDLMKEVGEGNYGVATSIAQRYNELGKRKHGNPMQLSEKQAYVVARAAVDNGLVSDNDRRMIFNYQNSKDTEVQVSQKENRKRQKRAAKYAEYEKTYQRSTTKIAIGSHVTDSKGRKGVITGIITPSTGYVTVDYGGYKKKEMAFNLKGEDGNPLKKRPKH